MPNPKVRTLTIGGVTYDLQDNISGYITGITSSDVTTALGFTPYNATNPNGYTSNTGTITSVKTTAGAHTAIDVSSGAANFNVPTKTSHLTNDSGFLTSFTETDPTVPSWAKASSKPSYTASEVGAVATSAVGAASGVAPLNASSKIDSTYLPSYVDDVIEGYYYNSKFYTTDAHTTEISGESGKIFVDLSTNKTYRYGSSTFTEVSQGSIVTVSRNLTSGTKSATITIDGTSYDLYSNSVPASTGSATTGVSIANHSTTSITGVADTITVSSKKSGSNGSASTWTFENITVPIRADSATTVPTAAVSATTVPIKNADATAVPTAAASATSCDDITNWSAGSGSLTFTIDSTDTKKLVISHTHTAPTLSYTARSITGVDGSTSIYGVQSTTTSVTGVSGSTSIYGVKNGSNSTTTASHVSGGGNGTAPSWVFEDKTVAVADVSATTVVTSNTHSITDNGHTHTI